MFNWLDFLLFLLFSYFTVQAYLKFVRNNELMFLGLSIAAFSVVVYASVGNVAYLAGYSVTELPVRLIEEWASVVAISFTLCALAVLIHNAKPAFARFPLIFTALPLLIIAVHPMAIDTIILKQWLLAIYQGGALLIGLMLYAVMATYNRNYAILLVAIVIMGCAYLVYWTPNSLIGGEAWVWKLLLGTGATVLTYGYNHLEQAYTELQSESSISNPTTTQTQH